MKKVAISLCIAVLIVQSAGAQNSPLNKSIIQYVESHMGKEVDRGECWDLAAKALEFAGAELVDTYFFGRSYDPKKEKIQPGDILQFSKVKTEKVVGDLTTFGNMYHHTAIVYKVLSDSKLVLAEQNGKSGRRVGTVDFDLSTVVSGKIKFYRPI